MKIEFEKYERELFIYLIEKEFKGYIVEYEEMQMVKKILKKLNCSNEEIKRILK